MRVRQRMYLAGLLAVVGVFLVGIGLAQTSVDDHDDAPGTATERPVFAAAEGNAAPDDPISLPAPSIGTNVDSSETAPVGPAPESAPVVPTRVRIPSIGVNASMTGLGLNPDRTLEVPENVGVAGWWTGRSVPGEVGPSIVVGHIDSRIAGPGVFHQLFRLSAGDTVEFERSDGSIAEFRVTDSERVAKDEFPTERVYGDTDEPTLRLITCGGNFDRVTRSYDDNVIVYAEYLGTREPPPVSRS